MRQRVTSLWSMVIVMASLALLSACSSAVSEPANPSQAATGENSQALEQNAEQIAANLPADFPVTMYQGDTLEEGEQLMFSDVVAQGKPVVLNFWAGLCPPCRLEMPDLQAASDEYEDRVLLLGLDVGPFTGLGTHEDGRRLLRDLEITYPVGTTSEPEVLRAYEVRGMPSTYFILPDGEVHVAWTGILTHDRFAEIVDEMLATAGS